jgi:hypothetical protein
MLCYVEEKAREISCTEDRFRYLITKGRQGCGKLMEVEMSYTEMK